MKTSSQSGGIGFFFLMALALVSVALLSMMTLYSEPDSKFSVKNPPEVDAVICLAGGKGRINEAAQVFLSVLHTYPMKGTVFLVAGMGREADWESFKSQVSEKVFQALPRERVILETRSRNTIENAKVVLREANARYWKKILILTSSYHLKRAQFLFEREASVDPDLQMEWIPVQQEPFTPSSWWRSGDGLEVTAIEWVKWIYYRGTAWQH